MIVPLLGFAVASALAGCDRQNPVEGQGEQANAAEPEVNAVTGMPNFPTGRLDRSHAGMPAPGVDFEDPFGRPARIADFRGRPVLVNLWATWCGPCVTEMPSLDALAEREGARLQVLALSQDMGEGGRQKVTDFFAERRFNRLEPYLDSGLQFMAELHVDTLPTTILYDAEGREVWRMTGLSDWQSSRAARLLTEARGSSSSPS